MLRTEPKARLIRVAIDLFGREGPDGAGTRKIAEAAGVQMSTITYYFGGKDHLYLACAEHIAATMRDRILPLLQSPGAVGKPSEARTGIETILSGLSLIIMPDEIAHMARFVVREQMNPTPAFAIIYEGAMRHVIEALANMLRLIARGELSQEELSVRSFTLIGQVLAFRFARAALIRSTGWTKVGAREVDVIRSAVLAHTRAVLADIERQARS